MPKCPRCDFHDDAVAIAVHLMQDHNLTYEQAQEWIRGESEKCAHCQ